MNSSNAKTNVLRDRAYSTPEHDALQLWLFDKDNQRKILEYYYDSTPYIVTLEALQSKPKIQYNCECVWETDKITEFPIYGYNRFIISVVDCILTLKYSFTCSEEDAKLVQANNQKIGYGSWFQPIHDTWKKSVLCEIKPRLDSISSLISQIKIYKDNLSQKFTDLNTVVITTDENTKFDKFLLEEKIRVFRVNKEELL